MKKFLRSALELLQTAIDKAGFTEKVVVGMDVAASEFYREGKYDLDFKSPPDSSRHISAEELADIYQDFVNNYPGGRRGRRRTFNRVLKALRLNPRLCFPPVSGVHRGPV